jgi:endonuclease-3
VRETGAKRPSDPRGRRRRATHKKPFRFGVVLRRIRAHVEQSELADAAMFELRERGYGSLFQQLVACIISIRTYDEVSLPAAIALLDRAPTPEAMLKLSIARIDALIRKSTFHRQKAETIRAIAKHVVDHLDGELPCDFDTLVSLKGVGPKCANLALGVACGASRISVDIHVHRVTNRWGVIATKTPERTMEALERVLPKRYWIEINRLLVPFGKHVCTGRAPKCSTCPVLEYCRQVGVTEHR